MTLLIIEFHVPALPHDDPDPKRQLLHALLALWPSAVAFLLSFGTILIMWINHHGLFKHAHGADNRLLFANGFLMLIVTFVPFPTWVLAEYLDRRAANVAATFYCATFVLNRMDTRLREGMTVNAAVTVAEADNVALLHTGAEGHDESIHPHIGDDRFAGKHRRRKSRLEANDFGGIIIAHGGEQFAACYAIGAQPVQDGAWKAGQLRDLRIAMQRIAVAG